MDMNIPDSLTKLLNDVIMVLLTRINIPEDEIVEISGMVHEKEGNKMHFDTLEGIDIQKSRRIASEKAREEGREEGREVTRIEVARNLRKLNTTVDVIAAATGLSAEEIEKLL